MLSSAETDVIDDPTRISSRQHPLIRTCRDLARGRPAPDSDGAVLLDGAHLAIDALGAAVPLRALLVSARVRAAPSDEVRDLLARASAARVPQYEVTSAVLDAASPVRSPSGVIAIAEWRPSPLAAALSPSPALAVGLVDVQDPGNVGAVIRSADALGATGVWALGATAHPGGWKTLRASMGGAFRLPVATGTTTDALAVAREGGLISIACVVGAATPLEAADLRRPLLLLIGSEGAGLPHDLIETADERVSIPMRAGANSLNVAATAAVLLYEARRQRTIYTESHLT